MGGIPLAGGRDVAELNMSVVCDLSGSDSTAMTKEKKKASLAWLLSSSSPLPLPLPLPRRLPLSVSLDNLAFCFVCVSPPLEHVRKLSTLRSSSSHKLISQPSMRALRFNSRFARHTSVSKGIASHPHVCPLKRPVMFGMFVVARSSPAAPPSEIRSLCAALYGWSLRARDCYAWCFRSQ